MSVSRETKLVALGAGSVAAAAGAALLVRHALRKPAAAAKVGAAAGAVPEAPSSRWTEQQVADWLLRLGVGERTAAVFRGEMITGDRLLELSDQDIVLLSATASDAERILTAVRAAPKPGALEQFLKETQAMFVSLAAGTPSTPAERAKQLHGVLYAFKSFQLLPADAQASALLPLSRQVTAALALVQQAAESGASLPPRDAAAGPEGTGMSPERLQSTVHQLDEMLDKFLMVARVGLAQMPEDKAHDLKQRLLEQAARVEEISQSMPNSVGAPLKRKCLELKALLTNSCGKGAAAAEKMTMPQLMLRVKELFTALKDEDLMALPLPARRERLQDMHKELRFIEEAANAQPESEHRTLVLSVAKTVQQLMEQMMSLNETEAGLRSQSTAHLGTAGRASVEEAEGNTSKESLEDIVSDLSNIFQFLNSNEFESIPAERRSQVVGMVARDVEALKARVEASEDAGKEQVLRDLVAPLLDLLRAMQGDEGEEVSNFEAIRGILIEIGELVHSNDFELAEEGEKRRLVAAIRQKVEAVKVAFDTLTAEERTVAEGLVYPILEVLDNAVQVEELEVAAEAVSSVSNAPSQDAATPESVMNAVRSAVDRLKDPSFFTLPEAERKSVVKESVDVLSAARKNAVKLGVRGNPLLLVIDSRRHLKASALNSFISLIIIIFIIFELYSSAKMHPFLRNFICVTLFHPIYFSLLLNFLETAALLTPPQGSQICNRQDKLSKGKELLGLWKDSPTLCSASVAAVVVLILKQVPSLPTDALRRHYAFLESVAKSCLEETSTLEGFPEKDRVAMETISAVFPYHNANDKAVRLSVVSTIEILFKALDHTNLSDERQDIYQKLAEALKCRVHDRCPQVREHAVAAAAAFQLGKRDCDVTQQLMALLCTDSSADVRRQILRCVAPKKEFLEGYFHGMIRSLCDVVARVRCEAWDALGRFAWRYITAYASAKNVHFAMCLYRGLSDSSASVVIACKSAMTNSWLHRDCKHNCTDFLSPIISGYPFEMLEPYEVVSDALFKSCKHAHPDVRFNLPLDDVHTTSLLMWKMECKYASERVEDDPDNESAGALLPLETFSALLEDVVHSYTDSETKTPNAETKVAKFRSTDDADNMLRIVLSVFDIYHEDGYLAHADNTARRALLKTIGVLLTLVPDDDPSLFVDVCIRALKSLSARTPEEAGATVTSALDSLFRTLRLPRRYSLGFEDVEAFGRKSRERQQELIKRKVLMQSGQCSEEEFEELKAEVEKDEKFLLRIQFIVWSYLSNSERGEAVPTFCTHVIQLGRHAESDVVQTVATKSLGLLCLVRPETVHTFMPVILADTALNTRGTEESVAVAAVGVVVDLIMEYGLNFFRVSNAHPLKEEVCAESLEPEQPENPAVVRLARERLLAEEDVHKVGSHHLVHVLLCLLDPINRITSSIMTMGCCKLLSANRLPKEKISIVLALLLLHWTQFQTEAKESRQSAYWVSLLQQFFRSYAASHPRRQTDFVSSGLIAIRLLLFSGTPPPTTAKLITLLLRTGDAFVLSQIRDIDPSVAQRVREQEALEDELDGGKKSNRSSANLSLRSSAARSSMQSGRLVKELGRHSQHERVAVHLLLYLAEDGLPEDSRSLCVDVLEKQMYFYSKEPQPLLHFMAKKALAHPKNAEVRERLELWLSEFVTRFQLQGLSADVTDFSNRWAALEEECGQKQQEIEKYGGLHFDFVRGKDGHIIPFATGTHNQVKEEPEESTERVKRGRTEAPTDPFDVDTILGSRKKVRFRLDAYYPVSQWRDETH
eukprot:gene2353-1482_t